MNNITDTGPLDWRIAITDGNGRPTNEFMRRWNTQRNNNGLINTVTVANGAPGSPVPADGNEWVDNSETPAVLYVAFNGAWIKVGVYEFTELGDVPSSYAGQSGKFVQVNSSATGLQFAAASSSFISITAGIALSGERAVMINSSSKAVYPSIATLTDGEAVVGITTGAIANGASGLAQTAGVMTEPSWSWTPGGTIYVDNLGVLTQTVTTGKWLLQIGVATLATEIIITPRTLFSTP